MSCTQLLVVATILVAVGVSCEVEDPFNPDVAKLFNEFWYKKSRFRLYSLRNDEHYGRFRERFLANRDATNHSKAIELIGPYDDL